MFTNEYVAVIEKDGYATFKQVIGVCVVGTTGFPGVEAGTACWDFTQDTIKFTIKRGF